MDSCEFLAHPGEKLSTHLIQTSRLAEEYASEDVRKIAGLVGLLHDIGKATRFFQEHLRSNSHGGAETHHSYFGAVFCAWVAKQRGFNPVDRLVAFMTVSRHHGNLEYPEIILPDYEEVECANFNCISGDIKSGLRTELKALLKQIENLKGNGCFSNLCENIGLTDINLNDFFNDGWKTTLIDLYHSYGEIRREERGDIYWRINEVFSCLIDADKRLSADFHPKRRKSLREDMVDIYLKDVREKLIADKELQRIRERLYHGVNDEILSVPLHKLFPAHLTITAPTGSGKTLTGLNAALKLRERVKKKYGYEPRIIYSLPYINLIKQSQTILEKVLERNGFDPKEYLIAHHHLAPVPKKDDENEKSVEEQLMFMESWDSEIIITTFVQFFQTLVSNSNRSLKKLHNIRGSIVILDEIQSIKAEHWNLIRAILKDIKKLEVTVISMTATQPKLVDVESIELAPPDLRPRKRVSIELILNELDLQKLGERIAGSKSRSILVVLNTIKNSINLHRKLTESPELSGVEIFYLSTNITPCERKKRLEELKRKLGDASTKEKIILVSTQTVEAGVDIDFEEGYREISPLDSILQVSGRVNRNGNGTGRLEIFSLENGKERFVYGAILPSITKEILNDLKTGGALSDTSLMDSIVDYYTKVEEDISQEKSEKMVKSIFKLDYKEIGHFSLIKDLPTVRIFVELNDKAKGALKKLKSILKTKDWKTKRIKLRALLPTLELFTINVSANRVKSGIPRLFEEDPQIRRDDILYISECDLEKYYDLGENGVDGTGFRFFGDADSDDVIIGG